MQNKINVPMIFAARFGKNFCICKPIDSDKKVINAEIAETIIFGIIGTITFRMPYVIPIPNASMLREIAIKMIVNIFDLHKKFFNL